MWYTNIYLQGKIAIVKSVFVKKYYQYLKHGTNYITKWNR